jgi:hypothetical protein
MTADGCQRKNNNETEFSLYRYGSVDLIGLSNRICAWQTAPDFKIKRKIYPHKLINCRFSQLSRCSIKNYEHIKEGNDACSKN